MRSFYSSMLAQRWMRCLSLWLVFAQLLALPAAAAPARAVGSQPAAPRFGAPATATTPADPTPLGPRPPAQAPLSQTPHAAIAPAPLASAPLTRSAALPTLFFPNTGQTDPDVRFLARGPAGAFFFTPDSIVLATSAPLTPTLAAARRGLRPSSLPRSPLQTHVRQRFLGAALPTLLGEDPTPTRISLFTDPDQSRWRAALPTFAALRYHQLYPGIDLRVDTSDASLKSTYTVAPGADPARIRWRYQGAQSVRLDEAGNLQITLPAPAAALTDTQALTRTLVEHAPVAWQTVAGQPVPVAARFLLDGQGTVRFALGAYDRSLPLTIDPTVVFQTLFGGSDTDHIWDLTTDQNGSLFVGGDTKSFDFPLRGSAPPLGDFDAFVARFSRDGSTLDWVTFFGGKNKDRAAALQLAPSGELLVAADFGADYTVPGSAAPDVFLASATAAHTRTLTQSLADAVVLRIEPFSGAIIHATVLSSSWDDYARGLQVDSAGNLYVLVYASRAGYPLVRSPNSAHSKGVAVTKLNPSGTSILWSTICSGDGETAGDQQVQAYGFARDRLGNLYLSGTVLAPSTFPLPPADRETLSGNSLFVQSLASDSGALRYTTVITGSSDDAPASWEVLNQLAVTPGGSAVLVSQAKSKNLPTTPGVFQPHPYATNGSDTDLVVARLTPSGARQFVTYLGGPGSEAFWGGVAVDAEGSVYLVANSASGYPSTGSAFGTHGAVLTRLSPDGKRLRWSGFIGNQDWDSGETLRFGPNGTVLVGGITFAGFPTSAPGYQHPVNNYRGDASVLALKGLLDALPDDQESCPCDRPPLALKPQPSTALPVNTRTGTFWTRATDLRVETPGVDLTWTRSYVSRVITETHSGLGFGWQHPFADRLLLPGSEAGSEPGTVILLTTSGNRHRFRAYSDGTFEAFPGVPSALARDGSDYLLTLPDQSQRRFDPAGHLKRLRDPQGRVVELSYDASGNLTRVGDAARTSRALTLVWSGGQIASVSDGSRTVAYSYSQGDLSEVRDVMNRPTAYTYQGHLLKSITNALGQVTEAMVYDQYSSTGRVVQQTLLDGQTLQFLYLPATTTVTTTGADGRRSVDVYEYDELNTLRGVRHNGAATLGSTFDSQFAPSEVRDGNNHATQTSYDRSGRLLSSSDALGHTTTYQYSAAGDLVSQTDPLGVSVWYLYDDAHRLLEETRGVTSTSTLRATTRYRYSGDLLEEVTAPDGVVTRSSYTPDGLLASVTAGYGTAQARTTSYGYDALGRRTTVTTGAGTPLARTDRTEYNPDNTVARTIANWVDGVYDPAHSDQDIITSFGYDALGRPSWVRDALGHLTASGYNSIGQLAWSTRNLVLPGWSGGALPASPPPFDPARPDQNVSTLFGYDTLGRTVLLTQTGFLAGTFNPTTRSFSASSLRVERRFYDYLDRLRTTISGYDGLGLLQEPDRNLTTTFAQDGAGNLTAVTDPLDRTRSTSYDARNLPVQTRVWGLDQSGMFDPAEDLVQTSEYDALGRLTRQIDNYADGVFSTTEPLTDRVTLYQYDTLSRVLTTTQNLAPGVTGDAALNRTTLRAYDPASGRLLGTRDALGSWEHVTYDLLGQVMGTLQNCRTAAGQAQASGCAAFNPSTPDRNVAGTSYAYDGLGRLRQTTDASGLVQETRYDGLGRPSVQVLNPQAGQPSTALLNVASSTSYDALGQPTASTDALGAVSRAGYDGLGRTVVLTDALGRVTRSGYDPDGSLRWREGPDGDLSVIEVDRVGHPVTQLAHYQDGAVGPNEASDTDLTTRTTYDAAGQVLRRSEPDGRVTSYAYDVFGHLVSVSENTGWNQPACVSPCGVTTRYRYSRDGHLLAITDPRGNTRRFSYNAAGELLFTSGAADSGLLRQYDAGGHLIGTTDPRGGEFDLSYRYDGLGRLVELSTFANLSIQLRYNAAGQRVAMEDESGTTSYVYDVLGRLTQVSQPGGTVGYSYDARGQRVGLSYPDGSVLSFAYRADGALERVGQGLTVLASYQYDAAGRPAEVTRANGTHTSYGYDRAGRVTSIEDWGASVALPMLGYTYDRAGQVVGKQEGVEGTGAGTNWRYRYDGQRRLTQVEEQHFTATHPEEGEPYEVMESYGYDLAGNRTDAWRKPVNAHFPDTAHYEYDAKNRVVGWSYDAAGNVVGDGQRTYFYDALNRLVEVSGGGSSKTYRYNGDGVLAGERVGTGVTTYTQDIALGLPQLLQEQSGAGVRRYGYGLERLYEAQGTSRQWYTADAQGSVQHLLSEQGTLLGSAQYDAWGQPKSVLNTPFGYTGELQDPQTGLVYLRARWYAPGQGRFVSQDTYLGDRARPDTLNPYAYVGNSPLNRTDPSGHCYPPAEFLRSVEPTNCANLDMALRIAHHPGASSKDQALAGAYIGSFVGSHAMLLVGAGILTWQMLMAGSAGITAVSQWGAAHIVAGTGVGRTLMVIGAGAAAAGTLDGLRQAWNGDPTAQAFLACPAAFGIGSLADDLAQVFSAGRKALFRNQVSSNSHLGVLANDSGGYFYDHQKSLYEANGHVYGQKYGNTCVPSTCKMLLADNGVSSEMVALAKQMKIEQDGVPLSTAVNTLNNHLEGTGVQYKYVEPSFSELRQFTKDGPVIVGVRAPDAPIEHKGHAIIIDSIDSDRIYLRDSLPETMGSSYSVSINDFLAYWKGTALVIKK